MNVLNIFAIQRQMKTEKLNIHNSIISVKTSTTEVYCNATINNISRLVTAGFFMTIPVSEPLLQSTHNVRVYS
jgi:hypothetical protein